MEGKKEEEKERKGSELMGMSEITIDTTYTVFSTK